MKYLTFLVLLVGVDASVLVLDQRMSKMIELSSVRPYCKIHTDRNEIQRLLMSTDESKIRSVSPESVTALAEACVEASLVKNELQGGLGFMYPGTKWCGPGNIAKNFEDLGRYASEDSCCRDHDMCDKILLPGECKRGLCNRGQFTRSHCDCDNRFRSCLKNINTETANTIGTAFFNVVQVNCFVERRPCSAVQSYNSDSDSCFAFVPSDFYIPSDYSTHQSAIHSNNLYASSKKVNYRYPPYRNEIDQRSSDFSNQLQLDSLELLARNLVKDFIIRPISGFLKYIATKKMGLNDTHLDDLCTRWIYQPSDRYHTPHFRENSD